MNRFAITATLVLTLTASSILWPTLSAARCNQCGQTYEQLSGRRTYRLYPYSYSYGPRHDPYWSYSASYTPYSYQGDGSYYGLGYSGYYGQGANGNYWYW